MGLKAILDSLDNVPAEQHDLYTEKDGKFFLDLEDDVKEHPSVAALSNAYRQEQTKRRAKDTEIAGLKARVEGLPEDFDGAAYEALKEQAEGKEPPKTDDQVVRVREQLERKHANDLAKKDERIAVLEKAIEGKTVDDDLSRAMDEANIDPKHKKKLAPYLKALGNIKMLEEDGRFTAEVETDMGPVSLAKFVSDWAGSDDGKEYVGKPTGLDARGANDTRKFENNPFSKQAWSKTAQGAVIREDRAKAERMARAAGFKSLDAAAAAIAPPLAA